MNGSSAGFSAASRDRRGTSGGKAGTNGMTNDDSVNGCISVHGGEGMSAT